MKHFDLGKLLGFVLLGLQAYSEQDQPGAGPKIFLNPAVTSQLIGGVIHVLSQQVDQNSALSDPSTVQPGS